MYAINHFIYAKQKKKKKQYIRQYIFIDKKDLQQQSFLINYLLQIC